MLNHESIVSFNNHFYFFVWVKVICSENASKVRRNFPVDLLLRPMPFSIFWFYIYLSHTFCLVKYIGIKGGFYSERADEFVISPIRRTKLFSWAKMLNFFHSKWLKTCQVRTWKCSITLFEHSAQPQVPIWHDLSHLEWKKI